MNGSLNLGEAAEIMGYALHRFTQGCGAASNASNDAAGSVMVPGSIRGGYWVASHREAMLWINAQAQARPGRRYHVLIGGNPSLMEAASYHAAENITMAYAGTTDGPPELPAHVDYYLATSRFGAADKLPEAPIVHGVGRTGAVFTVIKGRSSPDPFRAGAIIIGWRWSSRAIRSGPPRFLRIVDLHRVNADGQLGRAVPLLILPRCRGRCGTMMTCQR